MTLVPKHLPDYVERGGGLVYRPPYAARQVVLDGFVVPVDQSAVDALVQNDLVEPTAGEVEFHAVHDHVIVAFTQIQHLSSADAADSQRGSMSELEVSIWCLVADVHAGDRLCWYLPYVFTDSAQTMATGREVYGYPKQTGTFHGGAPLDLAPGAQAHVEAVGLDPFDPSSTAAPAPMITVRRSANASGALQQLSVGATLIDEAEAMFPGDFTVSGSVTVGTGPTHQLEITLPGQKPAPKPTVPWPVRKVLQGFGAAGLVSDKPSLIASLVADPRLVFLKQFRDVACPTKACYQAIIEAPLEVDPMGASYQPFDASELTVEFADLASHPIATDLGIAATPEVVPSRAFRAQFGFDTLLGEELWRRP